MRLTKKREDGQYLKTIKSIDECMNKLGQYEDIDENPEHLAKVSKSLDIIKEKYFIQFEEKKRKNGVINYVVYFNTSPLILTKEMYDLLKEELS